MDIRAFGSVFGQVSELALASGFAWNPSDGEKKFPTCRRVFIEALASSAKADVYVEFSDGQGQYVHLENLLGNQELPFAITAISGGTIEGAIILF